MYFRERTRACVCLSIRMTHLENNYFILGAAAYLLGNTSSCTIIEVKQH